jgi:hypothetical protein
MMRCCCTYKFRRSSSGDALPAYMKSQRKAWAGLPVLSEREVAPIALSLSIRHPAYTGEEAQLQGASSTEPQHTSRV